MRIEKRVYPVSELRVTKDDNDSDEMRLTGHAVVFDTPTNVGGAFIERISPRAFRKTLKESDQVALWNHDDGKPLGRVSAGTLILKEDDTGLFSDIHLPPNSWGNDAHVSVERGDVKGMSFAFSVTKENWSHENDIDRLPERDIKEIHLIEVSPVTFPQYTETDIEARAILSDAQSIRNGAPQEPDDDTTPEPGLAAHSEAGTDLSILGKRLDLLELETRNMETKIP